MSPAGGARPGAGRPKIPASKKRSVIVWVTFTPGEARKIRGRARKKKLPLDDWIRWKTLR